MLKLNKMCVVPHSAQVCEDISCIIHILPITKKGIKNDVYGLKSATAGCSFKKSFLLEFM